MNQNSFLYANGRVAVLALKNLSSERFLRMLESKNIDESVKVLFESGYADGMIVNNANDFELLLDKEQKQICDFLKEVSAEEASSDCFLLPFDYQNAKILMKAKYMRKSADEFLSQNGLVEVELLKKAILEDSYDQLPVEMKSALQFVDSEFFAGNRKPTVIDIALDKAFFQHVARLLKKSKSSVVKEYFKAEFDMKNFLTLFRVKKAKLGIGLFEQLFVSNGCLAKEFFIECFDKDGDKFKNQVKEQAPKFAVLADLLVQEYEAGEAFSKSEVFCENFKKEIVKKGRDIIDGIEPLVNFFLTKKTEIENIRLILVGLKNNVDRQQIKQRLRELYV